MKHSKVISRATLIQRHFNTLIDQSIDRHEKNTKYSCFAPSYSRCDQYESLLSPDTLKEASAVVTRAYIQTRRVEARLLRRLHISKVWLVYCQYERVFSEIHDSRVNFFETFMGITLGTCG